MSWNIGDKRNLFLELKSKLGPQYTVLKTPITWRWYLDLSSSYRKENWAPQPTPKSKPLCCGKESKDFSFESQCCYQVDKDIIGCNFLWWYSGNLAKITCGSAKVKYNFRLDHLKTCSDKVQTFGIPFARFCNSVQILDSKKLSAEYKNQIWVQFLELNRSSFEVWTQIWVPVFHLKLPLVFF